MWGIIMDYNKLREAALARLAAFEAVKTVLDAAWIEEENTSIRRQFRLAGTSASGKLHDRIHLALRKHYRRSAQRDLEILERIPQEVASWLEGAAIDKAEKIIRRKFEKGHTQNTRNPELSLKYERRLTIAISRAKQFMVPKVP